MIKPDEQQLRTLVLARGMNTVEPFVRDLAASIGMHPKRTLSLCLKWSRQGWYNYGVSADLGWAEAPPTR